VLADGTEEHAIIEGQEWRIANYDESCMQLYRNNDGEIVLARKGKKHVHILHSACREPMTLAATVLGNDKRLNACLVHKGKKNSSQMLAEAKAFDNAFDTDTLVLAAEKRVHTTATFRKNVDHMCNDWDKQRPPTNSIDDWKILIIDGAGSHDGDIITTNILGTQNYCRENAIKSLR
jgi:hypothetical protein